MTKYYKPNKPGSSQGWPDVATRGVDPAARGTDPTTGVRIGSAGFGQRSSAWGRQRKRSVDKWETLTLALIPRWNEPSSIPMDQKPIYHVHSRSYAKNTLSYIHI